MPILAPGTRKTRTGRLWTYVRKEAPHGSRVLRSPDRKGARPLAHLARFSGVLQVGYAGFNGLYEGGRIVEAACWAHVRRKFFDVHAADNLAVAREALEQADRSTTTSATSAASRPMSNGGNPEAYLRDVLGRIAENPSAKLSKLLPWCRTPRELAVKAA